MSRIGCHCQNRREWRKIMNEKEMLYRMLYEEVEKGIKLDFLDNLIDAYIAMDIKLQRLNNKLDKEQEVEQNETN